MYRGVQRCTVVYNDTSVGQAACGLERAEPPLSAHGVSSRNRFTQTRYAMQESLATTAEVSVTAKACVAVYPFGALLSSGCIQASIQHLP